VAGGSAAIGAVVGGITGGWKGALDGACDGFMWGGVGAGASMVGKAIQAAKIGTSFGKLGTLVKYKKITINWGNTTTHMIERMAERGMSKSLIESVIRNGKRLSQSGGKFIYITKKGAVVIDSNGTLITGYGSKYFDATMKSVVKSLFK